MASGIALIPDEYDDPMELFVKWLGEAKSSGHLQPELMSFATSTKDGDVNCRSLVLRKIVEDSFIIVTDSRSLKSKELIDNPICAAVFLWVYEKDGQRIYRQVRIKGMIQNLSREVCQEIYDKEPLFCRLRSHVCHQGQEIHWETMKEKHDKLLNQYEKGEITLEMPNHFVGYKITPSKYDFYFTHDSNIADRLLYQKDHSWTHCKISA